jgi:hypothetical protein
MDNIVSENKSIVLGIIRYIIKHFDEINNKTIIIHNNRIRHIIKYLFDDLIIKKKSKHDSDDSNFVINIKNNSSDGLIINNINNLTDIYGKTTLLPWYDEDNPIVMFKYNKHKQYDIERIKHKINTFTKNNRTNWYNTSSEVNFSRSNSYNLHEFIKLKYNCNIPFKDKLWDIYMEYNTLAKYCKRYDINDIYTIHDFITQRLNAYVCPKIQFVQVPIHVPVPVQVQPEIKPEVKVEPKIIQVPTYILVPYKETPDNKHMKDLLTNINDKIKITNKLINLDI